VDQSTDKLPSIVILFIWTAAWLQQWQHIRPTSWWTGCRRPPSACRMCCNSA